MIPLHLAAPLVLWLLPLAIIPLLLTRRRPAQPPRVVGNLYLWRDITPDAADRLAPIRRRLTPVALAQMLAVAAMVFALSGPALDLRASHLALVIDLSASMAAQDGAATRLGTAIARARTLVASLPQRARVRVVTAAAVARDRGEFGAHDAELSRLLDTLTPTAGRADLASAIAMTGSDGDVVVLSDLPAAPTSGDDPRVHWQRVGRAADNVAVSQLVVRPAAPGTDGGAALVEVRNFGRSARDVSVEVSLDNRRAALRTIAVPAGKAQTFTVGVPSMAGVVSARLLTPDALPADDVRMAGMPQPSRVAYIGAPGSFVSRALAVNADIALQTIASPQRGSAPLSDFDVVVCDGCAAAPAAARNVLLVSPGGRGAAVAPLALVNGDHPVAASLDLSGTSAAPVPGAAVGASDIIARAAGLPALTAYERDGRRVAELRIDLARGDFALSPAFPILIADAVQWLADGSARGTTVTAGEPLRVADADDGAGVVVTGPDGRRRATIQAGRELVVSDTAQPGVYRVRGGVRGDRALVVNAAVDGESDLEATAAPATGDAPIAGAAGNATFSLVPICALAAAALAAFECHARVRGAA